jgi:hypothetical protein
MRLTYRLALLLPFLAACQRSVSSTETGMSVSTSASTTGAPGQWRSLFDGKSLDQWRGYKMTTVPPEWTIVDGTIVKEKGTEDIVTKEQFQNFELELDWKLGPGGNAGVFYRGNEEFEHIYWTAPEYQLLDDARHPDGKNPLTSAASDYGLYAPPRGVVHPAGEWNSTRIVVNGNHVEHWLNGQKVVAYELGSADWTAKVQASKFREWPMYGKLARGYIAIQGDHSGSLALRNLRIKVLP